MSGKKSNYAWILLPVARAGRGQKFENLLGDYGHDQAQMRIILICLRRSGTRFPTYTV
jgi:hypothetical protein